MAEKRIFWYDIVRVAAMLMVLMLHCYYAKYSMVSPSPPDEVFWRLLGPYFLLQSSNGLFFMLSGALLLHKEVAEGYPVYWRRVAKFLFLLVFWSVFTNTCIGFYHGLPVLSALKQALADNTIIFGGNSGVALYLWFLPVIMHLYLAAPFAARMARKMKARDYLIFAGISCGLLLLPATLNVNGQFHSIFNASFSILWGRFDVFGPYVSWFLLGYFLAEFDTEAYLGRWCRHYNCLLLGGVLGLIGICLVSEWLITGGKAQIYLPFHSCGTSFLMFVETVLMFVLLKHSERYLNGWQGIISRLAKRSFGIYLCHFGLLCLLLKLMAQVGITPASPGGMIALYAYFGMLFGGWGIVSVLSRFRITRFFVS